MKRALREFLAVLAIASLVALGIMGTTSVARPSPVAGATTAPLKTNLRVAMPDSSPTVDPAFVADEENVEVSNLLYQGLVRLDASYRVVPAAATYSIGKNRRTYTFYVRKGLKFSNGDPLTAADFRYSITRSLSPGLRSPSASSYLGDIVGATNVLLGKAKSVSGMRLLNRYALQITTRWPVPYFLLKLTYPTSFALDSKRLSKLGGGNFSWYTNPISSGPYRLKSWTPNYKMIFVPNKRYSGPKPGLKQITVSLTPLPSVDLPRYVSKNLDVAKLPPPDRNHLQSLHPHETKLLSIAGLYMNFRYRPFSDVNVRRALMLSVQRNKVVSKALGATVTPFAGFVPPGQLGYNRRLQVPRYSPSAARKAFRASGYGPRKPFPAITLFYADDQYLTKLVNALVSGWHKTLKITVQARPLTLNTLLAKVQTSGLPFYLSGWSADYPDPHDWLSEQWKSQALENNVNYRSRKFDSLAATADVTWDTTQRLKLYSAAQQVLISDAAWIPLYVPHNLVYLRPSLSNLLVTGYGVIPKGGNWANVRFKAAASRTSRPS